MAAGWANLPGLPITPLIAPDRRDLKGRASDKSKLQVRRSSGLSRFSKAKEHELQEALVENL
jgi:hypothetical protein